MRAGAWMDDWCAAKESLHAGQEHGCMWLHLLMYAGGWVVHIRVEDRRLPILLVRCNLYAAWMEVDFLLVVPSAARHRHHVLQPGSAGAQLGVSRMAAACSPHGRATSCRLRPCHGSAAIVVVISFHRGLALSSSFPQLPSTSGARIQGSRIHSQSWVFILPKSFLFLLKNSLFYLNFRCFVKIMGIHVHIREYT